MGEGSCWPELSLPYHQMMSAQVGSLLSFMAIPFKARCAEEAPFFSKDLFAVNIDTWTSSGDEEAVPGHS